MVSSTSWSMPRRQEGEEKRLRQQRWPLCRRCPKSKDYLVHMKHWEDVCAPLPVRIQHLKVTAVVWTDYGCLILESWASTQECLQKNRGSRPGKKIPRGRAICLHISHKGTLDESTGNRKHVPEPNFHERKSSARAHHHGAELFFFYFSAFKNEIQGVLTQRRRDVAAMWLERAFQSPLEW